MSDGVDGHLSLYPISAFAPIWHFSLLKFKIYSDACSIKPFSTGLYTPWPNRAEAALSVFMATLHELCSQVGSLPELKQVTVIELLRKTAAAMNSMVTYGGTTLGN